MGSELSTSSALKIFLIQSPRYEDYRAIIRAENEQEALIEFAAQVDLEDCVGLSQNSLYNYERECPGIKAKLTGLLCN